VATTNCPASFAPFHNGTVGTLLVALLGDDGTVADFGESLPALHSRFFVAIAGVIASSHEIALALASLLVGE